MKDKREMTTPSLSKELSIPETPQSLSSMVTRSRDRNRELSTPSKFKDFVLDGTSLKSKSSNSTDKRQKTVPKATGKAARKGGDVESSDKENLNDHTSKVARGRKRKIKVSEPESLVGSASSPVSHKSSLELSRFVTEAFQGPTPQEDAESPLILQADSYRSVLIHKEDTQPMTTSSTAMSATDIDSERLKHSRTSEYYPQLAPKNDEELFNDTTSHDNMNIDDIGSVVSDFGEAHSQFSKVKTAAEVDSTTHTIPTLAIAHKPLEVIEESFEILTVQNGVSAEHSGSNRLVDIVLLKPPAEQQPATFLSYQSDNRPLDQSSQLITEQSVSLKSGEASVSSALPVTHTFFGSPQPAPLQVSDLYKSSLKASDELLRRSQRYLLESAELHEPAVAPARPRREEVLGSLRATELKKRHFVPESSPL